MIEDSFLKSEIFASPNISVETDFPVDAVILTFLTGIRVALSTTLTVCAVIADDIRNTIRKRKSFLIVI